MIILDTNVLSELMHKELIDPQVKAWMDSTPLSEMFTTTVVAAELLYGAEKVPDGRRKSELADLTQETVYQTFRGKVLPFTLRAARHYAAIVVSRERRGRPIGRFDAQIAAVCRAWGATVATRNVKDFRHTGVTIVNPWTAETYDRQD